MLLWEFHLHSTINFTAQRSKMASTMMLLGYVQQNAIIISYYLLSAFFSYWFARKIYHCFKPGLRELPGPKIASWTRLWRVWAVLSGNYPVKFRQLHEKHGKLVRVGPNHISVADPAAIPKIYGFNNKYLKSDFYHAFQAPYKGRIVDNLFATQSTEFHKSQRSQVAHRFSMSSLAEMQSSVDGCTKILLDKLRGFADKQEVVDIGPWLQWYAFDVIGAITFSQRFGCLESGSDVGGLISGIEDTLKYVGVVGQLPELHPWLIGNAKLITTIQKLFPDVSPVPNIIKIIENQIKKYDLEGKYYQSKKEDFLAYYMGDSVTGKIRLDHDDLVGHCLGSVFAGSDTTAIALRAIFYYLLKNPRVYAKLMTEIDSGISAGHVSEMATLDNSMKMPYLQACMKEGMRLHPIVGQVLERCVPKGGDFLSGHYLPEGTVVGIHAWVIHHDPSIFGEDHEDFRPERWIENSAEKLKNMEKCFLAFGAGSRLEWAYPEKDWKLETVWFTKQTDLFVRLKARQKANGTP
ncbi:uncharacterized protein TrAtP1_007692 [Trichoderma atroviride]|uniref:uncharacterized protein n=1 Tax=Hypocrea atroviridis TaxID=63577 RepID=UPI003326E78F|nr:hypothetical protein TrAtP1_007692 [Trichoderma atroviride]